MSIQELRAEARRLYDVAVAAADPAAALRAQVKNKFEVPEGGRLFLIAVGKAAVPMLKQAMALSSGEFQAVAVTNYENASGIPGAKVFAAGHPVPDENGLKAAQHVARLLTGTTEKDRVVALISGGGSALLPLPVEGISLADKAGTNQVLLSAGFDITQMNLVRQQLSRMKGGGMARHASPAKLEAFILSDVIGDDLRAIASGPTVAPIGTKADARALLTDVWDHLPDAVQTNLSKDDSVELLPDVENHLICSNRKSLEAMQAACPGAVIFNDRLEGNVRDAGPELFDAARNAKPGSVLLFGGETTVTLTGDGLGGRNQDLALRFASLATELPGEWVFLSGGTDGRDGPTEAAGGIVDPGSLARMRKSGADPLALLDNNDSNAALAASGDLLITGGTGTNVADVQVFLRA